MHTHTHTIADFVMNEGLSCVGIEIKNFTDGEHVKEALLLLQGRVQRAISPNSLVELRQLQPSTPQVAFAVTRVSRNGDFKLLIDLRVFEEQQLAEVQLVLHLQCGEAATVVSCVYKQTHTSYKLQPLLIESADYEITETQQCEVIDLNLRLVQCIYAHKLRAAGFGRCTFTLNGSKCQRYRTRLTRAQIWQLSEQELWQHFASELLNDAAWQTQQHLKFVAFNASTRYDGAALSASADFSYDNIRRHLQGHAALGGGGLALFSTAFFYAWPRKFAQILSCFNNSARIDCTRLPDDSNYRRTYGGVYATTLGAVCHELGHTFDLGHTRDGIMGSGFDYVNRLFSVDTPTENLPERLVVQRGVGQVRQAVRFTKLKQPHHNSFLQKYREQQLHGDDSFFFTRNCCIILAHHKWLRDCDQAAEESVAAPSRIAVTYDNGSITVTAQDSQHTLRAIEVRTNADSFVTHCYEFSNETVCRFALPAVVSTELRLQRQQHIFVLTARGYIERIDTTALDLVCT